MSANTAICAGQCCRTHYLRAAYPLDGLLTCKTDCMPMVSSADFGVAHKQSSRSATHMALRTKSTP
jgi:hypothetical protein